MFEIYEFEKITKNIYDDVREYCITEKVDEEYLRSSLIKDGEKKSMKRIIISVAAIGLFIIAMLSMTIKMDKELKSLKYFKADLNELKDGIYQGQAETTFVKVTAEVEVNDHKIIRIDILNHDNGFGEKAESITKDMIHMNTYEVDTVSGATSSSQVIKSAVSDALTKEM